jgi:hypothetical protein
MHYHLEIIMPPTDDVESAVAKVLGPFDENYEDEDGDRNKHAFWDFYRIGGRWAGEKIRAQYPEAALNAFYEEMKTKKVTVSGLQAGKQELSPATQIPMVDAIWRKHFPDGGEVCPLFAHYADKYENSTGAPDICALKDIPVGLTASHVIIASEDETVFMIQESIWNGVTHVDSKWDGKVMTAVELFKMKLKHYSPEYAAKVTPKDDWLCVTVDYHS